MGAVEGALGGFMVAGPWGALVGGVSGLIGGFVGAAKKRAQAAEMVRSSLGEIDKTVKSYMDYSLEYQAAIAQLDSVAGQGRGNLDTLGAVGRARWDHWLQPKYHEARQLVTDTEKERARRRLVDPGTPEFATGGEFVARVSGGPGLAVLHDGEHVMNRAASQRFRPMLEAMNAGELAPAAGGSRIEININAIDARSVREWLRDGGVQQIRSALAVDHMNFQGA